MDNGIRTVTGMGTKFQLKSNGQCVLTVPKEYVEAMNITDGDVADWSIESRKRLSFEIQTNE